MVESVEALSDIVIETLKEFSSQGLKVTRESLSCALASKKEILRLVPWDEPIDAACMEQAELEPLSTESAASAPDTSLPTIRSTMLKILAELAPISREEYIQRSSELQQRIQDCSSMDALTSLGDDLLDVVRLLIGRAMNELEHTRGFLAELGRDLSGVEKQILSYHGIQRATYLSNSRFSCELLSQADQMQDALDSGKDDGYSPQTILSKLMAIKAAVAIKQKEDQVRLQETDRKLSELQTSLKSHREEIVQAVQRAEELEKEVLLDSLTGIHNRRAYELRIREELRRYHNEGRTFSLILVDVDHFKLINDRYGHRTGDKCLREIAGRVKASIRKDDFLARYGGEELIVILPGIPAEGSRVVAEKIRSLIHRTHFNYQDARIPVTVSLGVTEAGLEDETLETIFTRADDAMYRSKNEGRNRVTILPAEGASDTTKQARLA